MRNPKSSPRFSHTCKQTLCWYLTLQGWLWEAGFQHLWATLRFRSDQPTNLSVRSPVQGRVPRARVLSRPMLLACARRGTAWHRSWLLLRLPRLSLWFVPISGGHLNAREDPTPPQTSMHPHV